MNRKQAISEAIEKSINSMPFVPFGLYKQQLPLMERAQKN
jgi:hypothetical protein